MAERDDIREEIRDKLAAVEARIETRLTEIRGQFVAIARQIADVRRDKWAVLSTIVGSAFALAVLIVTLATYGDAMFGRGLNVHDVVRATIKETLEQGKKP